MKFALPADDLVGHAISATTIGWGPDRPEQIAYSATYYFCSNSIQLILTGIIADNILLSVVRALWSAIFCKFKVFPSPDKVEHDSKLSRQTFKFTWTLLNTQLMKWGLQFALTENTHIGSS